MNGFVSNITIHDGFMQNHYETEELGYIPTQQHLSSQDQRSLLRKIVDFILSFFRELRVPLRTLPRQILSSSFFQKLGWKHYDHCHETKVWNPNSTALFVMLHGLQGHPSNWDDHVDQIKIDGPNRDLFLPYVPHKGNCSLEEAANPILEKIEDYTRLHPGKPVVMLGISNGSRIATYIETQLRDSAPQTPVMVSTIAGVHFGSKRMTQFNNYRLSNRIFKRVVYQELSFGSQKAKELLDRIKMPLSPHVRPRSYHFFASRDDVLATHMGTSLPILGLGEVHTVINGHGHTSLVGAVRPTQLAAINNWLARQ